MNPARRAYRDLPGRWVDVPRSEWACSDYDLPPQPKIGPGSFTRPDLPSNLGWQRDWRKFDPRAANYAFAFFGPIFAAAGTPVSTLAAPTSRLSEDRKAYLRKKYAKYIDAVKNPGNPQYAFDTLLEAHVAGALHAAVKGGTSMEHRKDKPPKNRGHEDSYAKHEYFWGPPVGSWS